MKLKLKDKNRLSVIHAFIQKFSLVCCHYVLGKSLFDCVLYVPNIYTDLFFPLIFSLSLKEYDLY